MKKFSFYSILACIFMMTTASTCSNDDDDNSNGSSSNPQPVINAVNNGTWRVTYYYDTDSEETNQFSGYDFTFGDNNVLTAANGTNTYTGTWSVTNSSGNSSSRSGDDDSNSDIDFNIAFASPSNFAELSDDWDIISYSSTRIELIDVSGGNGGTDYLTFEKN
ncbi:MAG TPA: hypothetical protein VF676_02145 [Flavobacterium sp.]|jgi:hypothetical protein